MSPILADLLIAATRLHIIDSLLGIKSIAFLPSNSRRLIDCRTFLYLINLLFVLISPTLRIDSLLCMIPSASLIHHCIFSFFCKYSHAARKAMIGKFDDNKPGFSFAKLEGTDNYKKWAQKMPYSLDSAGLWDHILSDAENSKPVAIVFKDKDLDNDAKLERHKKRAHKIISWTKNNVKYKDSLWRMCLGHI